MTTLNLDGMG
jgi:hypothetical protein